MLKKAPFADPYLTEEDISAVCEAVRRKCLSQGEYVERFERDFAHFTGVENAVAVSSGTAALRVALAAINVGSGDEVIVPSFSFVATANCVLYQKSKPIFVDINPLTYNIEPMKVKERITSKTKAIIPVHYGGYPADMDPIMELAEELGIYVIEDAAEAHGALYKGHKVGSIGHMGCFSFYPNKHMTTGEGGIVTVNDEELANKMRLLRSHGQDRRYHHIILGYNYRMTDIQAALGLVQLKRLNWVIKKKNDVAGYYTSRIRRMSNDEIKTPYVTPRNTHTYMLYTICFSNRELRDRVREKFERSGVETRIAFPPIHLQPLYQKLFNYTKGLLPITEEIAETVLSLPIYPHMKKDTQDYILSILEEEMNI